MTGLLGVIFFTMGISPGIWGSSMTIISAPPSEGRASGPPGDVQCRFAFSWIHSDMISLHSSVNRSSGLDTPWRMLWFVLVIRNTPGRGLGTYLHKPGQLLLFRTLRHVPALAHHLMSTSSKVANLTRACLMSATPPP